MANERPNSLVLEAKAEPWGWVNERHVAAALAHGVPPKWIRIDALAVIAGLTDLEAADPIPLAKAAFEAVRPKKPPRPEGERLPKATPPKRGKTK